MRDIKRQLNNKERKRELNNKERKRDKEHLTEECNVMRDIV